MGLRETLNKNPQYTTAATAGIIILAVALIVWQMWPEKPLRPPSKAYYTDDDGKSYFVDSKEKITPFQRNGKEAVLAHVYQYGTEKPFVQYMEKYSPEAKTKLDQFFADPKNRNQYIPEFYQDEYKMVKRPGMAKWFKMTFETVEACRSLPAKGGTYARELVPKDDEK